MKYLSLFSGIGGFELGIQQAYESMDRSEQTEQRTGAKEGHVGLHSEGWTKRNQEPDCIGYSEIDKHAIQTYQKHFPTHQNYGDITKIKAEDLPEFDLLVGGFPCQSFSIAGKRGGFSDTRGTLFFDIARILKAKQPRLLLLENVKGLLSHDKGDTFRVIIATLDELGYDLQWQVLNSKNHGVPQNRERVFIVGNRRGTRRPDVFPIRYEYGETTINEKVYQMSPSVSENSRTLLLGMAQSKGEKLSLSEMQDLFTQIEQGIQTEECSEVEREPQEIRRESKGNIQEVETLGAFLGSQNDTGGLCGVVQIPTKEMLLLWSKRGGTFNRIGQVQQQDSPNDDRQDRQRETLRNWEHSPLLFAVQPYQGRLFYSIGDGRDWVNIYQTKMEQICKENNLSSILEECVDPKYFLSEAQTAKILRLASLPNKERKGLLHDTSGEMEG